MNSKIIYLLKILIVLPLLIIILFFPEKLYLNVNPSISLYALPILIGINFLYCMGKSFRLAREYKKVNFLPIYVLTNIAFTGLFFLGFILNLTNPKTIEISKPSQLEIMTYFDYNYELVNDIDLKDYEDFQIYSKSFSGTLDGNGHTIRNLTTSDSILSSNHGTIKNINLDNINVQSTKTDFGILLNTNCSFDGTITVVSNDVTYSRIGGIVGLGDKDSIIETCSFNGSLSVDSKANSTEVNVYTGGIVGELGSNVIVRNCYSSGTITNDTSRGIVYFNFVSGIASGYEPKLENCYSSCDITGISDYSTYLRVSGITAAAVNSRCTNCFFAGTTTIPESTLNGKGDKKTFNVGASKEVNCYYLDWEGIKNGTLLETNYNGASWFIDTAKFSEDIWIITEGSLPVLRFNDNEN